jgi:hypothetical protein
VLTDVVGWPLARLGVVPDGCGVIADGLGVFTDVV